MVYQLDLEIYVTICIFAVFPTHNSARAINRTCIDHILTSSHIHYSDEPNAIIFIQVLALSHRAQVLINLEPNAAVLFSFRFLRFLIERRY